MVSDVHVPIELPAPSHLVRELRRRPLLRLHPPIGAGSPWIPGIDIVFYLRPPRHHRCIRRLRSIPGLPDHAVALTMVEPRIQTTLQTTTTTPRVPTTTWRPPTTRSS
ncbi:hypothetical protein ACQJBY_067778 [Aegilops geniculata]